MAINNGVILRETTDSDDNTVTLRVYYDATMPASSMQPLFDGPRGWCLDITNVSGRNCPITINGTSVTVGQGDPVISGPVNGRSRTAAQMALLGFMTRGSIDAITLG